MSPVARVVLAVVGFSLLPSSASADTCSTDITANGDRLVWTYSWAASGAPTTMEVEIFEVTGYTPSGQPILGASKGKRTSTALLGSNPSPAPTIKVGSGSYISKIKLIRNGSEVASSSSIIITIP